MKKPYLPLCALVVLLAGLAACSKNGAPPEECCGETKAANATPGESAVETAPEGTPALALLREPMDVAPFTATDLDGKTINSADLKGKVVLVNFWATWCPPCRAEIPDLVKLQAKYKDRLVILGISEDEDATPAEVKRFAVEQGVNYPIIMRTPELAKIFKGVSALPTTFVMDTEGKVRQRHVGMLRAETTELETKYLSGMMKNVKVDLVEDETKAMLANAAQAKEIPGVDLTKMTPAQRTAAIKAMNSENCTCGCELTIAACRINDPSCSVSLPLAKALAEKIAKS